MQKPQSKDDDQVRHSWGRHQEPGKGFQLFQERIKFRGEEWADVGWPAGGECEGQAGIGHFRGCRVGEENFLKEYGIWSSVRFIYRKPNNIKNYCYFILNKVYWIIFRPEGLQGGSMALWRNAAKFGWDLVEEKSKFSQKIVLVINLAGGIYYFNFYK